MDAGARQDCSAAAGGQPLTPMLANTITADMGLIPGLAFAGPGMGLPLSVLASFVERPFYTRAGVCSRTIWYSLQANLVSLLVGFALLAAGVVVGSGVFARASVAAIDRAVFLVWPFVAVGVSAVVERAYLANRVRGGRVGWGWSTAGNIVSAAACVGLLFCVAGLRAACPRLVDLLWPAAWPLWCASLAGSAVLFVIAFAATRTPSRGRR